LEIEEFQRSINLGLGRVILYLQNHSSEPYRDVILYACLHNTTYDRQLEYGKGEYIREIIRLSGEEAFYRQQVIDATKTADKKEYKRDTSHLLDIVGCFAREGDEEARQVLYQLFESTINADEYGFPSRIIDIDGLKGFVYVIEKIAELPLETHDYFFDDLLLWYLEDVIGEQRAETTLAELRGTNQKLDAYLKIVEQYRATRHGKIPRPTSPQKSIGYEELEPIIKTLTPSEIYEWSQTTDEESLFRVAIALEQETDTLLLRKYLYIFRRKAYPRPPQALFSLTSHKDNQIAAMTFSILEYTISPIIRSFALELIAKEQNIGRAIGLLERNFEESDWELIETATRKTLSDDDYHLIQSSVRDVFEAHPSPKAIQSLLNLYEYGVCSFCRFYILEHLVTLDALPESIKQECFYDSNEDIREWAKNGFKPREKRSRPKP
jgi:hypothetical protein